MAIPQLVHSARGTVLELGPCTGNQLPRLDKTKIVHVYGIECNTGLKKPLAQKIADVGLTGKYTAVWTRFEDAEESCGATESGTAR